MNETMFKNNISITCSTNMYTFKISYQAYSIKLTYHSVPGDGSYKL